MSNTPTIHVWRGKIVEEMSREELVATVVEMGAALNASEKHERDRRSAFGTEIREAARRLRERVA